MITNFIQLDFNKENDLKVPSVQYDSGSRFVKIKLQQNKVPFEINGYRVTVVANKVDGTEIMNDCTILDGANGLVEFEITEQFNAVEGVVDCQLKLFKDEILLTSMPFSISVVKSVSTKEIVSSNELKTLVNALGEVQNIDNRFAQTNAQLSEFNANKASIAYVDTKISAIANGSPKGVFGTLNDLKNSNSANSVEGKKYTYLVTSDGNWYYWNNTEWVSGGQYQTALNVVDYVGTNTDVVVNQKTLTDELSLGFTVENKFISSGGKEEHNTERCTTDYIRVSANSTITFYGESNNVYVNALSFYDKDKNYISGISNNQQTRAIQTITPSEIPSNTEFIRVSTCYSYLNQSFVSVGGIQGVIQDVEEKLRKDVKHLEKSTVTALIGKNLFNCDSPNIIKGKYLGSTGSYSSNDDYFVSDYIKVTPLETYSHQNFGVGGAYCCIYDENLKVVSSFKDSPVVIPENGYYVRMSGVTSNIDKQQFELGNLPTEYESYTEYAPLNNFVRKYESEQIKLESDLSNKLDKEIGKNLFDKTAIVENCYLNSKDTLTPLDDYFVSDYIEVEPNTTYALTNIGYNAGGGNNVFYDKNKKVLTAMQGNNTPQILTTPENCRYIRLTSRGLANLDVAQVELGDTATGYAPYTTYKPLEDLKNTLIDLENSKISVQIGKNLFNCDSPNIIKGKYLNSTGAYSTNSLYFVSDYIKVDAGMTYSHQHFDVGGAHCCIYDENLTVIETFKNSPITIPSEGCYVRMSGVIENFKIQQFELGEPTNYAKYTEYAPLESIYTKIPEREVQVVLPHKLYFAKNKQLCYYFENVLLKNLHYPSSIYFNKGVNHNRQVTFAFDKAEMEQTLKTQVINNLAKGESQTFLYDVVDSTINANKDLNILFVGDSFTDIGNYIIELENMLRKDSINVNLIGTCGNGKTFKAEGLSGGTLQNTFLEPNAGVARIVDVTGVTQIPSTGYPGQTYRDSNGNDWVIRGGKLDDNGNGKLVVTKHGATEGSFSNFPSSGVLTKQTTGVGDATINYSNPIPAYHNPFINHSTGVLDFRHYISFWGFKVPDIVVFQFTWNDLPEWSTDSQITKVVERFKTAIDHIHSVYPNTKVVLSIEPYGSINGNRDWNGKKYTVLNFAERLISEFEENEYYTSWVKIAPSYACVDLIYGYADTTLVPCSRYNNVTEHSGGDGVHPSKTGMYQISDCIYPIIHHLLGTIG